MLFILPPSSIKCKLFLSTDSVGNVVTFVYLFTLSIFLLMRHASFVRGHSNELDIAASITTVFMLIFFQTNCYLNNLTGLHVFDDFRNFQSLILIMIVI